MTRIREQNEKIKQRRIVSSHSSSVRTSIHSLKFAANRTFKQMKKLSVKHRKSNARSKPIIGKCSQILTELAIRMLEERWRRSKVANGTLGNQLSTATGSTLTALCMTLQVSKKPVLKMLPQNQMLIQEPEIGPVEGIHPTHEEEEEGEEEDRATAAATLATANQDIPQIQRNPPHRKKTIHPLPFNVQMFSFYTRHP